MNRSSSNKSTFLDKVLGRLHRLDSEGLQSVVQRLARERNLLETLFNSIEDGILVVDEEGRVVYCNRAAVQLLGVSEAGAEGSLVTKLLPQIEWDKIAQFDRAGTRGVIRQEFELKYPKPRFLRLYGTPLDGEEKGSAGVALILHDATDARRETNKVVESERFHALTLLAASVAHELGNPLNALHIHLQLMERELKKLRQAASTDTAGIPQRADKLEEFLGVAKGEIRRLDYIITEFLQAMRPTPPKLAVASLNDVVRETLALLQPELENRRLIVKEILSRQLPKGRFDPAQIKQVLVNLVKNAMQAMTKGGTLALSTGSTPDALWLSVSDTGCGIPSDHLARIFEPFYTTKQKGTGLGLMIVDRILRDHGGKVDVHSIVGKGTTFTVWLPLAERPTLMITAPDKSE
jgi:two-component system, sporulation sensor kinase E